MSIHMSVEAIQKIKKTNENIMIFTGIGIGTILILYFVTFSMLIDKGSALFTVQAISSVVLIFILVYIKRFSFHATKVLLGRREPYKLILEKLTPTDLGLEDAALLEKVTNS